MGKHSDGTINVIPSAFILFSGLAKLDKLVDTIWSLTGLIECLTGLSKYLTVLLEYINLEWQGTANIWVGLCPPLAMPLILSNSNPIISLKVENNP